MIASDAFLVLDIRNISKTEILGEYRGIGIYNNGLNYICVLKSGTEIKKLNYKQK